MPTPANSHGDHPNTYFADDRFSKDELARLQVQERMVTNSMGGVLPEQSDPTSFQRILDIACGPGSWLIAVAQKYPHLTELIGIDINARHISAAHQQADGQQVSERVQFRAMDALKGLEFPDGYFDLVNQRSATSYLRTWDWPKLLNEIKRITRVNGIVRLTEPELMPESNSQAFNQIMDLLIEAFYQSGHLFVPQRRSIADELPKMLDRYGFLNIQTRDYPVEYHAGTPEGELAMENTKLGMRSGQSFLRKWVRVPANYDELAQQALQDMQQPGFYTKWLIRTTWATVPTLTPTFGQK